MCSPARTALDIQSSPKDLGEACSDREAQSQALGVPTSGLDGPVERIRDVQDLVFIDPDATVLDRQPDGLANPPRADDDRRPRIAVFAGIVEQVVQ